MDGCYLQSVVWMYPCFARLLSDHCYADRDMSRYGRDFNVVTRAKDPTFYAPLKWNKTKPLGTKVFTCSWGDFFHRSADAWRDEAWEIILNTPNLTYQILTKREERMVRYLKDKRIPPNVWLGVSVENKDFAYRLNALASLPAPVRFVSAEPLLGPLDLRKWLENPHACICSATGNRHTRECVQDSGIHWVIGGGESGPEARPSHPDWIRSIRDQCQEAGVSFFFKQWGEWAPFRDNGPLPPHCSYVGLDGVVRVGDFEDETDAPMGKVGTRAAGALLDGREWKEMPEKEVIII